ncbi:kinase-like domain-containing protein [Rhizophagus irregularis DAOM 181602=DAOM 197198]|nr:kinase-like domain-containing protein [Rhizophagus irregularis DAOM 181602=DAOM 197198]
MDQQTNYKLKIDFLISSDVHLNHPTQTTLEPIFKKCNGCKRRRKVFNKIGQICYQCYKAKKIPLSGNKDIEFIAEGGFSQIYKATWIDGPIIDWNEENQKYDYYGEMTVALKELNNSESINSRELNELKVYYDFVSKWKPNKNSKSHRISNKEYYYVNINDHNYINICYGITQNPITKNFMIITKYYESGDLAHYIADNFFNYPWYKLIIEICDGVRPPIVTNAPEGYVELMKECWHSDPNKRPTANDLSKIFNEDGGKLCFRKHLGIEIIKSPDIGPITNNPNAIYKSRSLSAMIKSAESTRSLKIQRYKPFNEDKRKRDDNLIEDTGNSDYLSKELEFDIDNNIDISKFNKFNDSVIDDVLD